MKHGGNSPTTGYIAGKTSGGKSSVVRGGGKSVGMFSGGVKQGSTGAGSRRFDVTDRSLNRGGRKI